MSFLQLVTPPVGTLVPEAVLRAHVRVDAPEDSELLTQYEAAAHAWMDGRSGILGRAILPQTWAETFGGWGSYRLSLPDVDAGSVVVSYDPLGDNVFVAGGTVVQRRDGAETIVTLDGPSAAAVRVTYACAMSAARLAQVRQAALFLAAHWYRTREAVTEGVGLAEVPMSVRSLVAPLVWGAF
jgi:uncharacterized phiE125 gp8 family phage protein